MRRKSQSDTERALAVTYDKSSFEAAAFKECVSQSGCCNVCHHNYISLSSSLKPELEEELEVSSLLKLVLDTLGLNFAHCTVTLRSTSREHPRSRRLESFRLRR